MEIADSVLDLVGNTPLVRMRRAVPDARCDVLAKLRTDAPAGSFKAVTAGDIHSCGLRTDATITCWGLSTAFASGGWRRRLGRGRVWPCCG